MLLFFKKQLISGNICPLSFSIPHPKGKAGERMTDTLCSRLTAMLTLIFLMSLMVHPRLPLVGSIAGEVWVYFGCVIFVQFSKILYQVKLSKIEIPLAAHSKKIWTHLKTFIAMLCCFLGLKYLTPITGTLPLLILIFGTFIYAMPLWVRIFHRCSPMHDSPFKNELISLLSASGQKVNSIFILERDLHQPANAFICGTSFGIGPTQRTLFLTENLFHLLNESELKAVTAHEAAHLIENHLSKRAIFSTFYALVAVIMVLIPASLLVILYYHQQKSFAAMLVTVSLFTFVFQSFLIKRMLRQQEFQADLLAVTFFKTHEEALILALKKITLHNHKELNLKTPWFRSLLGQTHPSFEERAQAIQLHQMPKGMQSFFPKKLIYTYLSCFLLLSILAGMEFKNQKNLFQPQQAMRSIASENAK